MPEIPEFKCKPRCYLCCGTVPFSATERERASKIMPLVAWTVFDDLSSVPVGAVETGVCPFVGGGGCMIYPVRPMICKLFGSVDAPEMTCPHGCGPKTPLTKAESYAVMDEHYE